MTEQIISQGYPLWVAFWDAVADTSHDQLVTAAEMTDEDIATNVEGPFPIIAWRNCDGLPTPVNAITGDSPGERFITLDYDDARSQAIKAGVRERQVARERLKQMGADTDG